MASSDEFSFEWLEKPPGHSSPMHDRENEQICICLQGEFTLYSGKSRGKAVLSQYDAVWLDAREPHRIVNDGDDLAVGLDVFAPGLSVDFWTDSDD